MHFLHTDNKYFKIIYWKLKDFSSFQILFSGIKKTSCFREVLQQKKVAYQLRTFTITFLILPSAIPGW